ncbi:MAG: MotA/TolQ/ExbB proton channel family protein [Calditrichaeota bacterium]|nr:MotA/TolQ/ExbB proton channel family protein [Calditrichota bacterium]
MLEIFQKGGWMMYPLFLSSILALAIILERFWSLRRKRILIPQIIAVIDQIKTPEDFALARSVSEKFDGPFSRIVLTCIDNRDLPLDELRAMVEDEGRQQVRSLNRGLPMLETIAGVAPLLGLLGTVLGMIKVFNVIQTLGVGQAKALSGGIAEALVTTATGLIIGIPALIFFNYFNSRAEGLILDIEKYTLTLINKIIRMQKGVSSTLTQESLNFRSQ